MLKKRLYIGMIFIGLFLVLVALAVMVYQNQEKTAKQFVQNLLRDHDTEKAIKSLEKIGKPAEEVLIGALKNAEGKAKIAVIQLLGKSHSRKVVLALMPLLRDTDWKIRFFAAESLGKIGKKDATQSLLDVLRDETAWQVSQQIVIALNKIGYSESMPALINIFNNTKNPFTHILSAILLYEINEESIYKKDIIGSIRDKETDVKNQTLFTLKFMSCPRTIHLLNESLNEFDTKTQDLIRLLDSK